MTYKILFFTIRVYGLFINKRNEILITHEYQENMQMTKFPGGGLIPGESTIECLEREIMEETGEPIKNIRHFYTTDFFQQNKFKKDHQLISIYYLADFSKKPFFKISDQPFDFEANINGNISFQWKPIHEINSQDFTFPIDQKVSNLLQRSV